MSSSSPLERPAELAQETKFQALTRVGFFSRGLLYIVIGVLVLGTGRTEDLTGALEYVGRGIGQWLLIIVAVGTAAYGTWRMTDALFGIENPSRDSRSLRRRAAAAIVGAIYLYLAYKAFRLLSAAETTGLSAREQADTVLDLPGGQLVLGIAALVLLVAGGNQLLAAAKCTFLNNLDDRARAPAVKWLGRIGYAARGLIFLAVGALIGRAAIDNRSDEAGGMEQALDLFGDPLSYAIAAGLMLFGAFSIVEAIFRRIRKPPVQEIKQEVRDALGA